MGEEVKSLVLKFKASSQSWDFPSASELGCLQGLSSSPLRLSPHSLNSVPR